MPMRPRIALPWPRAILCAHLLLSPLIFRRLTSDAFEQPKAGLLVLAVIAATATALAWAAARTRWSRSEVASMVDGARSRAVQALAATARDPLAAGVWL